MSRLRWGVAGSIAALLLILVLRVTVLHGSPAYGSGRHSGMQALWLIVGLLVALLALVLLAIVAIVVWDAVTAALRRARGDSGLGQP